MSIERDQDFEQLEDIAAMMTENPGIEFENGKYVYYGLDARTAFAVVYIGGAWAGWQAAKAQAVPEGYAVVPVEPKQETIKQMNKVWFESNCAHIMKTKTAELLYKTMIEPQEPK